MNATLTDVQRNSKKVFRPVQSGQVVRITEHGKPFARVSPDYPTRTMTVEEFRALEISDEALNQSINESLAAIRE
jgi:prevent-host-death family protein